MASLPVSFNVGLENDLTAYRALAEERGVGLEIQHFADGSLMDGTWRDVADSLKPVLSGFSGTLSLHGPNYPNLDPAAWDSGVQALARERYLLSMRIAHELGARFVIFHCWYYPTMKYHGGVPGWLPRRAATWKDLARSAELLGVTVVLENTWEPEPEAQSALVDAVGSPALKACLDTGHATMTAATPVAEWVRQLGPRLAYVHAHSNCGRSDDHWGFTRGVLDAPALIRQLAAMEKPPQVCLEMRSRDDHVASLDIVNKSLQVEA
ncbi:MAG TPA: sugar phosphate isomerase/epimerase [Planctomycetota bacterium]|jgi:sugar phosphate isomerase/epimerase